MDSIDKKIVEYLKKEGSATQVRLQNYTFAREGLNVFRRRLHKLRDDNIIKIERAGAKTFSITLK